MGVFSKHHRYRNPGEAANVNHVERFGQPVRSLFTSSEVFSLHHRIDVTDGGGTVLYYAESQFFSFRDKTEIRDASGASIAHMERKFFSLHERHFIEMADGNHFEMSNELFHLVRDITNIEGLGWQLRGNLAALNFELYDSSGTIIAVICQKMFSLHDKYCVDLYQADKEKTVVAILITLQHMIRDRESASASGSVSTSSG